MQMTKVVIASALVLAVCARELPEGKGCVVKLNVYISDVKFPQSVVCYTKVVCSMINWFTMHEGKYSIRCLRQCLCFEPNVSTILHCRWSSAQTPEECSHSE